MILPNDDFNPGQEVEMASNMTSAQTAAEVRAPSAEHFDEHRQEETKPSFMTTEFWAMVAGIAALIVVYNVADDPSLDLFRTCLLCTLAGMAYVVSRGLAKAGAARRWDRDRTYQ
jgi:hypothetical protein